MVVSLICYYIELLVYNMAPLARIVLCQYRYYGRDGLRFLSQIILQNFLHDEKASLYLVYTVMYSSLEIVLCLCRWTVCVKFENVERLGSSCVQGGNYQ